MISNTQITAQPEYDIQFWNAMRNKEAREDILAKGRDISTGTYSMPTVPGHIMPTEKPQSMQPIRPRAGLAPSEVSK